MVPIRSSVLVTTDGASGLSRTMFGSRPWPSPSRPHPMGALACGGGADCARDTPQLCRMPSQGWGGGLAGGGPRCGATPGADPEPLAVSCLLAVPWSLGTGKCLRWSGWCRS